LQLVAKDVCRPLIKHAKAFEEAKGHEAE
jgi:hypothetical protein